MIVGKGIVNVSGADPWTIGWIASAGKLDGHLSRRTTGRTDVGGASRARTYQHKGVKHRTGRGADGEEDMDMRHDYVCLMDASGVCTSTRLRECIA